jgi:hypothetical protein
VVFFLAALTSASMAFAADSKRENPTSKVYVADVEGISSVTIGDKIEDLTKKSVYTAEGTVLETAPESTSAVVLSNGTGIAFDPDTRLEIQRFLQEPFPPDRTDMEVEPSVSQTAAFLPRGTVGLCTSKLVAGSTMTYSTRHGSVAIRGRKVVIETNDKETIVSLVEGDVTVRGDLTTGGQTLKPGQQAIITRDSNIDPPTITIRPIPKNDVKRLGEKVAVACMARKTVHFDVASRSNQEEEAIIVPVEVLPGTLSPEITVSPFNIPAPATP